MVTSEEKRALRTVIILQTKGLKDILSDLSIELPQCRSDGLLGAFRDLANAVGIDEKEVEVFAQLTFQTVEGHKKAYYFADLGDGHAELAESIAARLTQFLKQISASISNQRLSGMSAQQVLLDAAHDLPFGIEGAQALRALGVGSLGFAATVVSSRMAMNFGSAQDAIRRIYHFPKKPKNYMPPHSVSLALFRRPAAGERPTHVLTYESVKNKGKREIVGGGRFDVTVADSPARQAQRRLMEETFGLVSALCETIRPKFVWWGSSCPDGRKWYAVNHAMVVNADDDGTVECFPDTLEDVRAGLFQAFSENPLSTLCPENKGYQWTPVDEFGSVCQYNLKISWKRLYKKVVQKNMLRDEL